MSTEMKNYLLIFIEFYKKALFIIMGMLIFSVLSQIGLFAYNIHGYIIYSPYLTPQYVFFVQLVIFPSIKFVFIIIIIIYLSRGLRQLKKIINTEPNKLIRNLYSLQMFVAIFLCLYLIAGIGDAVEHYVIFTTFLTVVFSIAGFIIWIGPILVGLFAVLSLITLRKLFKVLDNELSVYKGSQIGKIAVKTLVFTIIISLWYFVGIDSLYWLLVQFIPSDYIIWRFPWVFLIMVFEYVIFIPVNILGLISHFNLANNLLTALK